MADVPEAEFEAMRGERDRFAFEKAELNAVITKLKEQVAGEQQAKDEALRKLEVTNSAWKSTILTKDALAQLAQYSPADASVVLSHIARAERSEQLLKGLIARIDRDGGHKQDADGSLENSADRADIEAARLLHADDELAGIIKQLRDDGHFYIGTDCVRCGAYGLEEEDQPCISAQLKSEAGVLKVVRAFLLTLTDAEREKFFYDMEQGYCGSCGRKLAEDEDIMGCQCTNDE